MPTATPVTIPTVLTVAIDGDPELHTPPVTASVNGIVLPTPTTVMDAVIVPANGAGFTVIIVVAKDVPQVEWME